MLCTSPSPDCNWLYMKTKMLRNYLDGATMTTCVSSLAPYSWQFKRLMLFLLHPAYIWNDCNLVVFLVTWLFGWLVLWHFNPCWFMLKLVSPLQSPVRYVTKMYAFTQPICHWQNVTQSQFLADYGWFEFRVFHLLDLLPYRS